MHYLTLVPKAVYRSAKRSLKGQEKLWIVALLWGWVLWWTSFVIGGRTIDIGFEEWGAFDFIPASVHMIVFALGIIFVFVYPFCLATSLYRCFRNTSRIIFSIALGVTGGFLLIFHIQGWFWIFGVAFVHFWKGVEQFSIIITGLFF